MTPEEQLRTIVAKVLEIDVASITEETGRNNPSVWDSFNHLFLISEIESTMGVTFTTEEVNAIKNFGDLHRKLLLN